VTDSKSLDAFHMKCQRRILGILWHQFMRNEEIAACTHRSPSPINHHLLPLLSHLWTPSEAWRRSTSSRGTP